MQPPTLLPLAAAVLLLAVAPTPAVSRHHRASADTETLDVAASLSRARAALSTDAAAVSLHQSAAAEAGKRSREGNTGLTLRLHSRDFLPAEQGRHETYRSLVLSRLRRDSARAAALAARATLAADGVTTLRDLRPANDSAVFAASLAAAAAAAIQGPVVSGVGQGSGEYFSRVGIGSPARQLYMVLDTGSDVTWVQCQPCADCYQQSDPVFNPSLSSSYAAVACDSPRCRDLDTAACRNATGACLYEVAYGDGSYTVGDFATETLTLGDSSPVTGVAIGCGHDNEGLFVGAAGLLALGGGPLSFPSQISASTFSYCLVDRDSPAASTLQFGGDAAAAEAAGTVTAPLLRSPRTGTFYYVALSGISVGGQPLSIPPSAFAMDAASGSGGVIVDSGTAVTRLQSAAYAALRDAFVAGTPSLPRTSGVSLFDTCYDLSDRSSVEVPAVSLRFEGGGALRLPAKNYLIPVDGAGTYCLAFAPTNAPVSIIGNVQQQGIRVSFDTAKGACGSLFPSSPRHRPAAAAASLFGFPPRRPASSRRLPYTAVRSSSTASPSAPVEEAPAAAAPTGDAEEERVVLPTNESSERLLRIRHTCAHVMAMAVQKLFPNSKVTIGPWIDNGFYYDFDMEPLTDKDLKKIKKEMDRIIRQNLPLVREEVSREEAQKRIEALNEPYKLEILESIKEEPITIYHIGEEWWDLCAGPHVESTGKINRKAVELESVAGAYWRGDEKNQMLQRIYGTAWENEDQLKAYIHFKEEAKRRDHRRLGQDLDLFSIQDDAGGGLVFWHPKGAIIRHILEDSWKQIHLQHGYDLLYTPHVAKADLWKISGHIDFYKENMYKQMDVEDEMYQLRPMNCPYHILVYKRKLHSYRDFPIRMAELGTVYRYELSGSLHGLFRVRGFTQDDAHIFCLEDQIKDEIRGVLDLTEQILGQFGFRYYEINLSTRPEKSVGTDDIWEKATIALKNALDDKGWEYKVDEGGGAFYGPKIDIKIEDALGRKWQCSTVQVDFNLPERFNITYVDSNSEKKRPIMIHRAILGSLERFFGVLIEHYAGDFPLWLAPTQTRILPVTDNELQYCNEVASELKSRGLRVEVCHGERLPKLIRNAETQKVPLMAVVGPKEVQTRTLTIRSRHNGEIGTMPIDEFITRLQLAVANKSSL